ncbi:MAG TPA: hypothetical protein VIV06_07390, partial [Candidatus Limnocylindrales bacterium]
MSNEHPIDSSAGLRILTGAASALARSVDLDASLRRLLDLAREVLGVPDGALFVQDPDLADFQPAAVVGFDEQGIARLDAALRQPGDLLLAAIRDRLPVRLQSGIGDEATDLLGQLGLRALALQPLVVVRGGIETSVGLMALGWDAGGDPPGNVDALVGPIAELAGVAIDRAQLASLAAERSEWFERMAHTDPLT